jgi:hypothetical protein
VTLVGTRPATYFFFFFERHNGKGQLTELVPQCTAQGVRVITAEKALRLNSAQPRLPKAIPRGPGINNALLSGGNPFTDLRLITMRHQTSVSSQSRLSATSQLFTLAPEHEMEARAWLSSLRTKGIVPKNFYRSGPGAKSNSPSHHERSSNRGSLCDVLNRMSINCPTKNCSESR